MAVDHNSGKVEPPVQINAEDYEHLLDDYSHFVPPSEGEILEGRVLKVTASEVIVDFGSKSEGLVPIEQFRDPGGEIRVQAGDVIDVMIDHGPEVEGYILLSHDKAARLRVWENLEKAFQEQLIISGRVLGRVKGGLSVDVGIKGFMPGSQVDPRPVRNLETFAGQDIPVKIIKLNRRRGNVVVSRKLAVEQEATERKTVTLEHLEEGAVVTGVVKNLTEYGAFIDLGGIDGLLHVTDMSYGRVAHPSEVVHPGDEVTVKVLKFDKARERVSLGMKQMAPDPWEGVAQRYTVNQRVVGRIVNVTDYGAFVELEPGVEGLIHVTEMTWSRRMKHPAKVVSPGDQVEAVVLGVEPENRRLSLGVKQLQPDVWETFFTQHRVGDVVHGKVLFRSFTEGANRAGCNPCNRCQVAQALAGDQAVAAGRLGAVFSDASCWRHGARQDLPFSRIRRVHRAGRGRRGLMPLFRSAWLQRKEVGGAPHIGWPGERL